MRSKRTIVIIALLLANLAATACMAFYLFVPAWREPAGGLAFETTKGGQYVLYIGTNDKDTYEQIIPTDVAIEIVNGICAKHVEGYTASGAQGGWVDGNGVLTRENTLVYTISYAEESNIVAIMDEILSALNQNAILIERRDVASTFYSGKD